MKSSVTKSHNPWPYISEPDSNPLHTAHFCALFASEQYLYITLLPSPAWAEGTVLS